MRCQTLLPAVSHEPLVISHCKAVVNSLMISCFTSCIDGCDPVSAAIDVTPRSVSIFQVGVWTRPTFKVFPYRQEKSRVALMPISQSAFARQRADAKSAP